MYKQLVGFIFMIAMVHPAIAEFRDPTQPAYSVINSAPVNVNKEVELRLSAIFISGQSRWATINGVQAKQGQTIAGNIKILKIRKNQVIINQNGVIKALQLIRRPYKTR